MAYIDSDLEKQLLEQMNISSQAELESWEKNSYPVNREVALEFWDMIGHSSHIVIIGDYDVDGVCSTYELTKAIKALYPAKHVACRIPHRMSEGYGINAKIAAEIREKIPKGSLVITVDNGIAAADLLESLQNDGYHVIVTDHHELGSNRIPEVDMVLNPKVPYKELGKENPFSGDYWCGAGVVYKLAEPMVPDKLKKELEVFAAMATVCDCMQLREGNWALVRRGMETIRNLEAPHSILDLMQAMKQDPVNVSEETFGFYLGPAINAGGRLLDDGAKVALDYFLRPTKDKCLKMVELNETRRSLRDDQYERVKEYITANNLQDQCPIWVYLPDLHEGIVGILAGMVAEEFKVPAVVLTKSEKDETLMKGSARTAGLISIFDYLQSIKSEELGKGNDNPFTGFGGHTGAAGLTLPIKNLELVRSYQAEKPSELDLQTQGILMSIMESDIPLVTATCDIFRPFGEGNPQPTFSVDVDLKQENFRMLGTPPVHLCIEDPLKRYKMLHFYHEPNDLDDKNSFTLLGHVKYDVFRDKKTAVLTADEIRQKEEEKRIKETELSHAYADITTEDPPNAKEKEEQQEMVTPVPVKEERS